MTMGSMQAPSLIMYNKMLKSLGETKSIRKVLTLFSELRGKGLYPDNFTLPVVLKSIGRLRKVPEGEKLHGYAVKAGLESNSYVCNSLMGMYAALGKINIIHKVFDEMPERDIVSWNGLISCYVRRGKFEDAIAVFKRMNRVSNLKPDENTIVSTLSACSAMKNLEIGERIHRYVVTEFEMSIKTEHALVEMFCKCGCLDKARAIFDLMRSKNVKCWTSMVSGYVSNGRVDEARELFERSPVIDVVLWSAMMEGYVQFNRFDEALKLFSRMLFEGLLEEAEELLMDTMQNESYGTLVPFYRSLLTAARSYGNVKIVERVEEKLEKVEVANVYASANRWEDLINLRRRMEENRSREYAAGSRIEVSGYMHEFLATNATHPKMDEIHSMLHQYNSWMSGSEHDEEIECSGELS